MLRSIVSFFIFWFDEGFLKVFWYFVFFKKKFVFLCDVIYYVVVVVMVSGVVCRIVVFVVYCGCYVLVKVCVNKFKVGKLIDNS